ncbi:MAG: hypothetical protein H7144_00750 [Burkholderiales bacterium]|nr:hypothetical protein [Phycisphaerae bacterium]
MQQFLKAFVGPTRARVVAPELLNKLFLAMHDALASFHVRLGREAATALTGALESRAGRDTVHVGSARDTSKVKLLPPTKD